MSDLAPENPASGAVPEARPYSLPEARPYSFLPDRQVVRSVHPAYYDRANGKGNLSVSRRGLAPRLIVLHTSVGSLESMTRWFQEPRAGVSAHYGIGLDGEVRQFVREAHVAFHAGTVVRARSKVVLKMSSINPNLYSIGIEHEDLGDPFRVVRTSEQIEASAELVARACGGYRIPLDREHVIPHAWVRADKGCPGNLPVDEIIERARAKLAAWAGSGPQDALRGPQEALRGPERP